MGIEKRRRQGHQSVSSRHIMLPDTVHKLPLEERTAWAKVLAFVSKVDGDVDIGEMALFESRMGTALFPPKTRERARQWLKDPPSLREAIDGLGREGARLAMRDAVLMTAADGEVDDNERKLLDLLAEELNIEFDVVDDLLDWVIDGFEWMQDGYRLLKQIK